MSEAITFHVAWAIGVGIFLLGLWYTPVSWALLASIPVAVVIGLLRADRQQKRRAAYIKRRDQ